MKKIFLFLIFMLLFQLTSCDIPLLSCQHELTENYLYDNEIHFRKCIKPNCDYVEEYEEHTFSEWNIEVDATHFTTGKQYKVCTKCNYEIKEIIPITDHVLTYHEKILPTCVNYGKEAYFECVECNKLFSDITCSTQINNKNDLVIDKIPHKISLDYEYVKPKIYETGSITFKCTCGEDMYQIFLPSCNVIDYKIYTLTQIDPTCVTNGKKQYYIKENFIRDELEKLVNRNIIDSNLSEELFNKMKNDMIFDDIVKTNVILADGHIYTLNIEKFSTYDSCGTFYFQCEICEDKLKNNDGYVNTELPKIGEDIYTIYETKPTCIDKGNISYSISIYLFNLFLETKYTLELRNDYRVSAIYRFEYNEEIPSLGHNYDTKLIVPTEIETGEFSIKCERCNEYFSNTENEKAILPMLTNSLYYDYTNTATCIDEGNIIYKYNESFFKLITDDLGLTTDNLAKYQDLFKDIILPAEKLPHTYNDARMELIKYPTLTETGEIIFLCDNKDCNHRRMYTNNLDIFYIPKITSSYYIIHSDTSTCQSEGIIVASLKSFWLEDELRKYLTDYKNYINNDTITPLLTRYELKTPVLKHNYTHTINYEKLEIYLNCKYDNCNETILLKLPDFPTSSYQIKSEIKGDCITNSTITYCLPFGTFVNLLAPYKESMDSDNYFLITNRLPSVFKYEIIGEKDHNNHCGTITFNENYKVFFPIYSGIDSTGYYADVCSACKQNIIKPFNYSQGTWIFFDEVKQAKRKYQIGDITLIDPKVVTSFAYKIDLDGGTTNSSTSINDLVPIGMSPYYSTSSSRFYKNGYGEGKKLEVYVDGKLIKSSNAMISIYQSLKVTFVDIYFGTSKSSIPQYANIYIKVIYEN